MDITDADLRDIGLENFDERWEKSRNKEKKFIDRQDLLLEIRREKLFSDKDELKKLKPVTPDEEETK